MNNGKNESGVTQNPDQRTYMREMLKQHEEFILIGLTGRIGSGCSEAGKILSSSFQDLGLPKIYPGNQGLTNDFERDRRILYRYADHHWIKFDLIRVRDIITSFVLCNTKVFCKDFKDCLGMKLPAANKKLVIEVLKNLSRRCPEGLTIQEQLDKVIDICKPLHCHLPDFKIDSDIKLLAKSLYMKAKNAEKADILTKSEKKFSEFFRYAYLAAENPDNYDKRSEILRRVDLLLNTLSAAVASFWGMGWVGKKRITKWANRKNINMTIERMEEISKSFEQWTKTANFDFLKYVYVHDIIPTIGDTIHELLSEQKRGAFTELYQKYGNLIRRYGCISRNEDESIKTEDTKKQIWKHAFSIPRRINQFIKSLRHPFDRSYAKPTRIVIDSLKSVLEASFLRERYSAFYLFAISAEEQIRVNRMIERKKLNIGEIHCIDWNEYSNYGAEIYKKYKKFLEECISLGKRKEEIEKREKTGKIYDDLKEKKVLSDDEIEFMKRVNAYASEDARSEPDSVRKEAYENNYYPFVLQDVGACIQNADVFISNNYNDKTNFELRWELVRNISLISYPGLLLPTAIERCMQVAFAAKANSGCLSRQVGAVVTDSNYNILSIGWNDVPCGDISCARKNLVDIYNMHDMDTYTEYEKSDPDFRKRVEALYRRKYAETSGQFSKLLCGLPWRYCFKDVHLDIKQPMRSRAMHAEEKALANVHENAVNGCLFTTSSPCEMCTKNAKNHRIKKIFYIEPYPGISENQYSKSGDPNNYAEHILFTGAIGRAYTQMYNPIMPHKDVLEALGL